MKKIVYWLYFCPFFSRIYPFIRGKMRVRLRM